MIKKIIRHIKHGDFNQVIKRNLYVKKNLGSKKLTDEEYLIGLGKLLLGYKMDLQHPKTFNEKLNWYKLNYHNILMSNLIDKIEAKKYVYSQGLSEIIIPTIKEYDNIEQICLKDLPDKFVIKNTLDSGGVFVCKNKSITKEKAIKSKLKGIRNIEIHNGRHWALENIYTANKNRIIVEELLETEDGTAPWDYKFFCFNGEPKFLFVGSDRDTNVCFDFFDIDFNHLDVIQGHPHSKKIISKPDNYSKMIEICKILSKDFPHVRVDLYNVNGNIYFGELTFYHFAGLIPFEPFEWDKKFGEYFDISKILK